MAHVNVKLKQNCKYFIKSSCCKRYCGLCLDICKYVALFVIINKIYNTNKCGQQETKNSEINCFGLHFLVFSLVSSLARVKSFYLFVYSNYMSYHNRLIISMPWDRVETNRTSFFQTEKCMGI